MSGNPTNDKMRQPWTLGAVHGHNLLLEAECQTPGCGWFCVFDLDQLIATFGRDYELPADGPDIPCRQCGATNLKFHLAYHHLDSEQ